MRRLLLLGLVAAAVSCGDEPTRPGPAPAVPASTSGRLATSSTTYTVIFLGILEGGSNSDAQDGNSAGVIVGEGITGSNRNHAYRWTQASGFLDLGLLSGGDYSNAIAINEGGVIAGDANVTPGGPDRAMRWTEAGGMEGLGLLPGGTHSRAIDVNELGHIVGFGDDAGGRDHAYLWTEAGGMVDLGVLLGGSSSRALDLNNVGQVVGHGSVDASSNHAFVWTQAGGFQDLGLLPGWSDSRGFDISDDGVVVGYGSLSGSSKWQAFRWTAAEGLVALPHLPNGTSSKAVDINEAGEIVGWDQVGKYFRAVLWPPSGGVIDLGCLPGTNVGKAYGITGSGVVVGECDNRATLWTPGGGGGGGGGAGGSIAAEAGNNQSAMVNTAVATRPAVRVTDANGDPMADVPVTFAVGSGGGSLTGAGQTTDANGIATVGSWTLGTTSGTNINTLTGTSAGLNGSPTTFTASATPGPAAAAASTATVPSGTTGSVTTITVRAKDQYGNSLATGGAILVVTISETNSAAPTVADNGNGTYTASYTPTAAGTDRVAITLDGTAIGGSPYASAVSGGGGGPAAQLVVNGGNNQSGPVGAAVQIRPSVKALDATGLPVANATVTFSIQSGGGSVSGGSPTTDASGVATVGGWTLGAAAGTNKLRARVSKVPAVLFMAAGTPAGPGPVDATRSTATVPNGTVGSATIITVQGNDASGTNVSVGGATVAASVTGANSATPAVTDNGNGTYTAAYTPANSGTDQVAITLGGAAIGGSPYRSVVSGGGTGGTATRLAIVGGNNQSAAVGTSVANLPSVRVTNADGGGVGGVPVTFAVAAGGGSVTGPSAVTDASGMATVGGWTLGTRSGTNRLTATSAGLSGSPATIAATAAAGPPARMAVNAGNNQTAPAGTAVAKAPSVKVTDTYGNGVPNATVTFVVVSGAGSIKKLSVKTGSGGVATVGGWTLGPTPGPNTLTATVSGAGIAGNPVAFIATGT